MKEYPESDFRVHAAPLALDFAPSAAALFDGCFAITLNTRIHIALLSHFEWVQKTWHDARSWNADEIQTSEQAMLLAAQTADYVIAPALGRPFGEQAFETASESLPRMLLWVPTQQHSACVAESRALASMIGGVHGYKRRSQLPNGELAQVLQGIIGSAHFLNDHRILIGLP
jgi:hypothetical protein